MNDSVVKRDRKVNVSRTKVVVFEKDESTTECIILIEERCGLKEDVVTRVERGMFLWFGHLERMNESRLTNNIYTGYLCYGRYNLRPFGGVIPDVCGRDALPCLLSVKLLVIHGTRSVDDGRQSPLRLRMHPRAPERVHADACMRAGTGGKVGSHAPTARCGCVLC
ncbi:hypothetical protein EVAR_19320_1 [Eumeta japonica]|uniref:Uncharacterized protein n=1 Tax=Eumeta variegata TaxID=151549 RepID=A0A4C1UET7_EUMVA|nr:hypothetical protein EVAR_19320_1 [Eumeta japonica]